MALGTRPLPLSGTTAPSTAPDIPFRTDFAQPVRYLRNPRYNAVLDPTFSGWFPATVPNVVPTADKYVVPFGQPQRFKRALHASQQQFIMLTQAEPFTPILPGTLASWVVDFDPPPFRPKFPTDQQQFAIAPTPYVIQLIMAALEQGDTMAATAIADDELEGATVSVIEIVVPDGADISVETPTRLGRASVAIIEISS